MGCLIDIYDVSCNQFYCEKFHKAKKQHVCCECNSIIEIGERYENEVGKGENGFFSYTTCMDCYSLKKAFFCNYYFGSLWEYFFEEFDLMFKTDSSNLYRLDSLTPKARARVFEWLEETGVEQ